MKAHLLVSTLLIFLTACVAPQAYFPKLPELQPSSNDPTSQHNKLSKMEADKFIQIGKTNVTQISMHYGVPNVVIKDSKGNDVWMYQAKSVYSGVKHDAGTNMNVALSGSSSLAHSSQGQVEVSSKSTLLKITLNSSGIVTFYESETTMN